ncbi:A disintegrin and metalloproteinase with thrombospondin motifs 7-like, partial [Herpailurus yagouaroundi]|uniref:A disintegrin and metalloproteinase with thrombospondin motifs 7-like n=1 Tax=Herpailurus yagouaroundi TaxID=1608482 RepID=UPI001AD642A3
MPPARRPCGAQPCLSWYVSSWRECSEACGGGEQRRLVTCPEPGLCEEALRPNSTRSCNTQPCTKWVVGPWGQVSRTRRRGGTGARQPPLGPPPQAFLLVTADVGGGHTRSPPCCWGERKRTGRVLWRGGLGGGGGEAPGGEARG